MTPAPATASISRNDTRLTLALYSARKAGAGRILTAARDASALMPAASRTAPAIAIGYHHQDGSVRTSGPSAGSVAPITSMKIHAPSGSPSSAAGRASIAPPATTV